MRALITWRVGLILAATALYIAVRFWRLTDGCLWFDEIFSVHAAEKPWNDILRFIALDLVHPPLFYVLLKIWIAIGGEGILWLRSFPVLFACLALIPFILFTREIENEHKSGWAALLALFLLAVNGSLIKYAQELRMYSLLLCLSLFSFWLFLRYCRSGKGIVILTVVNILLVYTQYFGWYAIFAEMAAATLLFRQRLRPLLGMALTTFVAFVPWLVAVWSASGASEGLSQNIGRTPRPGLYAITQFALDLVEPFYFPATTVEPPAIYRVAVPMILIAGISLLLFFYKNAAGGARHRTTVLLSVFTMVPIFAAVLGSWIFPYSVWGTRHLTVVAVPVALLISRGILSLHKAWLRETFIVFTLLLSGYAFVLQVPRKPEYIWCAWEQFAGEVRTEGSDLPIYVFEDLTAYHFWFWLRADRDPQIRIVRGAAIPEEDPGFFLPRGLDQVKTVRPDQITEQRFWTAFRVNSESGVAPNNVFFSRGYEAVKSSTIRAGAQDAYLVLMQKADVAGP